MGGSAGAGGGYDEVYAAWRRDPGAYWAAAARGIEGTPPRTAPSSRSSAPTAGGSTALG